MTKLPGCRWCGRPLAARPGPGRPRQFCRRSCRQRDYEARRRAERQGLDEAEIVAARAERDALRDQLYVLTCAVRDVRRDLGHTPTKRDYAEALTWVLAACEPLTNEPPDHGRAGSSGSPERR